MYRWTTVYAMRTVQADPKYDGILRNISDGTMEAYMMPPFASNHASFIEPLPNGDLVMAWFSGISEGMSNVAIVFSQLKNNSNQWSKAQVVSQRKGYSNQNPVFFYDNKTDALYLFHTQQEAKKSQLGTRSEESAEIWVLSALNVTNSSNIRFSPPRVMFKHKGSFDRNRVVVSLRNTWLYPIYYAGGSSKDQSSNLKECVDHNVFSSWLDHPFLDTNYLVQPSVIRPKKGDLRLVAFFRDRRAQYIYKADSSDDGKTWSKPTKTTLPNNNSGIEATVLSSGNFAIVYNPTNKDRNPLSISLSTDQGLTWKYTRNLEYKTDENGVEFSYPTLFQDSTGRIHISYTYNRETVKHRVIPNEQWIMQQ
ncbi:uncharacterized protein LOC133188197 [Saccostrea echinata]|uniref:uncharacterized protein LOC133188197 n=1 Tax=Saccostrea echinata TaxID=191078 RepID=UPI002A7F9DCE|nr:uncharacterized protein LOC133188197 [Saccostrea echinata]